MAAVIKCDGCGKCIPHKDATHVRTYPMVSATTYSPNKVINTAELCPACNRKLCEIIGKAVK